MRAVKDGLRTLDDHDSALDSCDSNGTVAQHGGWDKRVACVGACARVCVCLGVGVGMGTRARQRGRERRNFFERDGREE